MLKKIYSLLLGFGSFFIINCKSSKLHSSTSFVQPGEPYFNIEFYSIDKYNVKHSEFIKMEVSTKTSKVYQHDFTKNSIAIPLLMYENTAFYDFKITRKKNNQSFNFNLKLDYDSKIIKDVDRISIVASALTTSKFENQYIKEILIRYFKKDEKKTSNETTIEIILFP